MPTRRGMLLAMPAAVLAGSEALPPAARPDGHYLYVAAPGIRNYLL